MQRTDSFKIIESCLLCLDKKDCDSEWMFAGAWDSRAVYVGGGLGSWSDQRQLGHRRNSNQLVPSTRFLLLGSSLAGAHCPKPVTAITAYLCVSGSGIEAGDFSHILPEIPRNQR